jgi:hypothetical protein
MDASLYTLAENISTHGWVVTVFLVGFIATLVCSIFCTLLDRNVKEIVKLCGAFGIWLIALSINTWEFYLLLVPIGGLVVATEDFMLMFISVIMAEKKDVPKITDHYRQIKATIPKEPGSRVVEGLEDIVSVPTSKPPNLPSKS